MSSTTTGHIVRPDPEGPEPPERQDRGSDAAVRVRSTRDLLAAVPSLLGYRPHESLVIVCVGASRAVELVARVPLAALVLGPGERADARIEHLVSALRRVAATDLVVAVHSAREARSVRRLVDPVLDVLEEVAAVETWHVTPRGYRGLDCADPACCPPQGRPLAELEHRAVNAALVVAGRAVADSPEEAYRIPSVSEARRSSAARAATRADRAAARGGAAASTGGYDLWRDLMRHAARELQACGDAAPRLQAAPLGRLAAALADVGVRDAVLLSLVPGADDVARRTAVRGSGDEPRPADAAGPEAEVEHATARAVARMVDPREAVPPDPATADAARLVLEQVVAHVPRRRQAPALTLLGLLAWWQGEGGRAAHRVDAAAQVDPAYRLAALLGAVLDAAVPPGWVRTRRPGETGRDRAMSAEDGVG